MAVDNTFGAMFVGVVIAATLYGVAIIQTYYYYQHYRKDLWHIKALVTASFISDTIHQCLISHTVYTYLITNYANPLIAADLVWSLLVEVLFNGITALLVQIFFTIRIYKLSDKNRWLTGLVLIFVFGEFGAVIAYAVQSLQLRTFDQLTELKGLSMTVNALAATGDVLIAGVLCTMLHRSRTGFRRSNNVINKLIIFCVNTGLLTSICAVLSLITIAALPNTFIYICFYFTLGRLYLNSLLATLNARRMIRNGAGPEYTENISLSLRDSSGKSGGSGSGSGGSGSGGDSAGMKAVGMEQRVQDANGITIRIETETMRDPTKQDLTMASSQTDVELDSLSDMTYKV